MPPTDLLRNLFQEAAPLLELSEVLELTDESSWSLEWADGLLIVADLDETEGAATLTCHVGEALEEGFPKLARLLLEYNALWHETGGLRVGLEENTVVLIYTFPAADIDLPAICGVLTGYVEKARIWIEILEKQGQPASDDTNSENQSILDMLTTGIRA